MAVETRVARAGDGWPRSRLVFRFVRLSVLLALLAGAFLLNRWSHRGDPRFYAFLRTRTGRVLAETFGWWGSPIEKPVRRKSWSALTPAERRVLDELASAVSEGLEQDADAAGADRRMVRLTYRDVLFRREFPDLALHVRPPYAVIAESPGPGMERAVDLLRAVEEEVRAAFGPLLGERCGRGELIHVLVFASQPAYRDYAARQARPLENTSGFYSPTADRLVLYDPPGGDAGQTAPTIRHEGAHQLLFAYGVHSEHRIEGEWLLEGLATYCETPAVGAPDPDRARLLREARRTGRLIPLRRLVEWQDQGGLLAHKPAELAYSQAWALVHFLMQDDYRDRFFDYVRFVRAPEHFRAVRGEPGLDLLCRFLGLSPRELAERWNHYVAAL